MLNIRATITPINGVYSVSFQLDNAPGVAAISPDLQKKIDQLGQFKVNLGGVISVEGEADTDLGTDERWIPGALPFTRHFALADYDFAAALAAAYRDAVVDRIETALNTFTAQSTSETSQVYNLPRPA